MQIENGMIRISKEASITGSRKKEETSMETLNAFLKMLGVNSPYQSHKRIGGYNGGQIKSLSRRLQRLLMRTNKEVEIFQNQDGSAVLEVFPVDSGTLQDSTRSVILTSRKISDPGKREGYDWVTYPVHLARVLQELDLPAYSVPSSLCGEGMGWVGGWIKKVYGFTEDGKPIFEKPEPSQVEEVVEA